jgi:hypothetical protein
MEELGVDVHVDPLSGKLDGVVTRRIDLAGFSRLRKNRTSGWPSCAA